METLKDKLLDGKIIGETFRIPLTSNTYEVVDLHIQYVTPKQKDDFVCLVTKKSDGKEYHYNLTTRLDDIFVPSEQTAQTLPCGLSRADVEDIFIDRT